MTRERLDGRMTRNPARRRDAILKAAIVEFARHGYDGARVDRIVSRARISKNLLYHHFQSKESLFVRVMEEAYERMRRAHRDIQLLELGPVEGMRQLIRSTFAHFVEHPEIITLLNTENLHRARHIKKSPAIRQIYNPLLDAISELLQAGQEDGLFRSDVDPVDLYISISGLGYFYLSNQYTLSTIFQTELGAPERIRQRDDHNVEVIMGYLFYHPAGNERSGPANKRTARDEGQAKPRNREPAVS